jgi:hypothetical protein
MRRSSMAPPCITALCVLAASLSLAGLASAQQTAQSKHKLSQQSLLSQPPLVNPESARKAKPNAPPLTTTDTWTGGGSNTDWSNASNWNNGAITSGENILINLTTAATTVDVSSIPAIGTLTLSNAGDSATILNNVTLTVDGNITNNGSLNLSSTGNFTELVLGGNVTLSGTGTVTLSANTQNYIFGTTSLDQLTNQETIQGAGQIGHGQMALVNSGTIDADQSTATMTIDANDGFTNTRAGVAPRHAEEGSLVAKGAPSDELLLQLQCHPRRPKLQFLSARCT